jgi:hypothetical protein
MNLPVYIMIEACQSRWNFDISTQYDIEETSISKFTTSISLYPDNEDLSISTNETSMSVDDIENICLFFDHDNRISCSSIMIKVFHCLGCCRSCLVLDTDCRVHISLRINHCTWLMRRMGRPQPPQQGLHSADRQHRSHRAQPRPQPPEQRLDQQSTSS